MLRKIAVGDTFTCTYGDHINTFRREPDDESPIHSYERIRVTHLAHSLAPNMKPYTFGTEQEWFKQRGLEAE
jgi:hypothetical protein